MAGSFLPGKSLSIAGRRDSSPLIAKNLFLVVISILIHDDTISNFKETLLILDFWKFVNQKKEMLW